MAKKFELWMGVYPGGILCCNKAVERCGEYKNLCLISKAGNISMYVDYDYIPAEEMRKIEATAKREEEQFEEYVERELMCRPFSFYYGMLDCLNVSEYIEFLNENKGKTIADKIVALMPTYIARS